MDLAATAIGIRDDILSAADKDEENRMSRTPDMSHPKS
jgi:hypothetical protein